MGESNINKLPIWVDLLRINICLLYKGINFTVTFSLVYIIYLTLPPITLSYHPPLFFSLVSVLMSYIPISKSRFYIWKKIRTVYLSDFALFHLIWWPAVLSTFFKVSSLFFLWLNKTPLHIYTTYSLSVHPLMGWLLGWFHVLATVKHATTVIMDMHTSVDWLSPSGVHIQESKELSLGGFLRNPTWFQQLHGLLLWELTKHAFWWETTSKAILWVRITCVLLSPLYWDIY